MAYKNQRQQKCHVRELHRRTNFVSVHQPTTIGLGHNRVVPFERPSGLVRLGRSIRKFLS
jgi:hypothetical protein